MDSSNHADEETENKEGVEREDSVEENEPKLKYMRITNDLKKILSKVSANCIAIHPKFVCVGTDWGIIHILDHNGNSVVSKDLRAHSVAVNQISIDANGDHIASCSDDGKVFVTGLYNSDNNQEVMIGRLVKSVAIDPNYYKSGSGRRFISGDERLVLHEKTFLSRVRSTVLNDATFEGGVKNMRWSPGGDFLAWSTHLGFRVYDIATRESLGFVKWLSRPSDDNVKCHLCWKDNSMLIVGWAEMVRVCTVTLKTHQITTLPEVSPYEVRLIYTFQTDFTVCGVGPLDCWLVVLGSVKDGERPQLHIIDPTTLDFTNISTDNLSLRGYTQYTPSDYSLECLIEESRYVIVSPKDIVVACPYDINDRIEWLLNHGKFETALKIVSDDEGDKTKLPLKHSKLTVGLVYLDYLFSVENYQRAASLCFNILGKNKRLWEKEVYRFAKVHQLRAISSYLPTGDDRLLPHIYEMVLYEYLKMDPEGFLVVAKEWPAHYYNVPAVINAVIEHLLTTDPTSKPVILEALAVLYSLDGKHEKALAMSIKLRNKGVFELIKKHKLNVAIHDMVVGLMELDSKQAIATLLENKEIKPDVIVEKLKANRQYLYMYLDALDKKDTKLAQKYHGELVQLYADFDREKLLPLLKKSDRYPIEATLDICKNRKFTKEMVHLLGLIGSTKEALSLITKELGNIEEAVDFCIARDDLELWEDLISYSLNTQSFIIYLLKRIGTYIDPRILVQRIDNHMQIPGLKDALVKMLQDYNLQISVQEGFKKILVSDYFDLHQRFVSMQQRGISVGGGDQARGGITIFQCNHLFHTVCLTEEVCTVCSSQKLLFNPRQS